MVSLPSLIVLVFLAIPCWGETRKSPILDIGRLEAPGPGRCQDDLHALRAGLNSDQPWAAAMWDASVKAPVGLMSQTGVQFGDFDLCLTVSTPVTAQYCLVDVEGNSTLMSKFRWALCVPASCTPQDLQASVQAYMDSEAAGLEVSLKPYACTSRDTTANSFTTGDIVYCAVVLIIVGVVAIATIYDVTVQPDYDGVSPPRTVLQCLSARYGWHALWTSGNPVPRVNLSALYGLHCLAMSGIVFGHRFASHIMFMASSNNRAVEFMFSKWWLAIWLGHADLMVDIFFCMSAFIMSVRYLTDLEKRYTSPLKLYIYRFCRLVPTCAVVVFFYATLMRHLGHGPLWNMIMENEKELCSSQWWTNLLLINNYVGDDKICAIQTWFISADFQLFIVGVVLVLMLHKNFYFGVVITAVLFGASTVAAFLGTYLYPERPAVLIFNNEFCVDPRHNVIYLSLYSKSHYRGTTYLPGLIAGLYVFKRRNIVFSKVTTTLLQGAGLAVSLATWWSGSAFTDTNNQPDIVLRSLYAATYHTVFGVGFSMMITSFALGHPTTLSRLLAWKGFVPISKLSFNVYLVHFMGQIVWAASLRSPNYINPQAVFSWAIADVAASLVVAMFLYLNVEILVGNLVKFFVSGSRSLQERSESSKEFHDYVGSNLSEKDLYSKTNENFKM